MKTIDVAQILSPDLKSRMRAQDLKLLMENSGEKAFMLDFANVKFATRSFMDEFYHLLVRKDNAQGVQLNLINMDLQAQAFLNAVKVTADSPRKTSVPDDAHFFNPATVRQLNEYLTTL